jgi:hypothetical protein
MDLPGLVIVIDHAHDPRSPFTVTKSPGEAGVHDHDHQHPLRHSSFCNHAAVS